MKNPQDAKIIKGIAAMVGKPCIGCGSRSSHVIVGEPGRELLNQMLTPENSAKVMIFTLCDECLENPLTENVVTGKIIGEYQALAGQPALN